MTKRFIHPDYCAEEVHDSFGVSFHQCGNKPKYEFEGKRYCGIHYPPNVEARRRKSEERWAAESAASRRRHALQDAARKVVAAALRWYDEAAEGGLFDDAITKACREYRKLEAKGALRNSSEEATASTGSQARDKQSETDSPSS